MPQNWKSTLTLQNFHDCVNIFIETFETSWDYQDLSRLFEIYRNFLRFINTFWDLSRLFEIYQDFYRFIKIFEIYWEISTLSQFFERLHEYLNKFGTFWVSSHPLVLTQKERRENPLNILQTAKKVKYASFFKPPFSNLNFNVKIFWISNNKNNNNTNNNKAPVQGK